MPKYTKSPEELATPVLRSPRLAWENTRKPVASMRLFAYHGHNVMLVQPDLRPKGWRTNDVVPMPPIFDGDVSLVPECNGDDGIPDWAIAEVVRGMNPNLPLSAYAIREQAKALVKEYRP